MSLSLSLILASVLSGVLFVVTVLYFRYKGLNRWGILFVLAIELTLIRLLALLGFIGILNPNAAAGLLVIFVGSLLYAATRDWLLRK